MRNIKTYANGALRERDPSCKNRCRKIQVIPFQGRQKRRVLVAAGSPVKLLDGLDVPSQRIA